LLSDLTFSIVATISGSAEFTFKIPTCLQEGQSYPVARPSSRKSFSFSWQPIWTDWPSTSPLLVVEVCHPARHPV